MLKQLHIHHVRNLLDNQLTLGQYNVFIGANGSGKTSLLEAVFLLARGRSFRHHQPKHYIHHHHQHCTVWAMSQHQDTKETFALQKNLDASTQLRHNGQPLPNQSVITRQLPTLVLDPTAMGILENGSQSRRQLLDWLAFHLFLPFYQTWLDYNRLLRQRNALLRPFYPSHQAQIHAWDNTLEQHAQALHRYRQEAFDRWQTHFLAIIKELLPQYHQRLQISYQAGFDHQGSLVDILKERLAADIELGYTRIGAHRFDLAIHIKQPTPTGHKKEQAINVLSRGEKKMLITALKLSQLPVICQQSRPPLVLIDDIDAELDRQTLHLLLTTLVCLPCQLFITSLHQGILDTMQAILEKQNQHKLVAFDVKHGNITPIKLPSDV